MSIHEEVVAHRVVVVDRAGRERIILDAGWKDDAATLAVLGKDGASVLLCIGGDDRPQVAIGTSGGRDAVTISFSSEGYACITVSEPSGLPAVRVFTAEEHGMARVEIYRNGQVTWASPNSKG